jgi:sulfite reductase (ferredoxin)
MRQLAGIAARYVGDTVRATVEQNIVLRWVRDVDLRAVYGELAAIGLGEAGAGTLVDITACPGTDTCKLGIASSRGLAAELRTRLLAQGMELDEAVRRLHVKVSGCFNSCGQHHIADIGFYGVSRNVGSYKVPHFQVVLGGQWEENAGAYGLAIAAVPSKRIPDVVTRLADRFVRDRRNGETFQQFTQRVGKRALKEMFDDLTAVPAYADRQEFYSDWGDPRVFTMGDMGVGECAGEVVSLGDFELATAEAQVFEAQVQLDEGDYAKADALAYKAMLLAARGLVKRELMEVSEEPDVVVREFRARYHDTRLFHDKYAGGKFAQYLFHRHAEPPAQVTVDTGRRIVEEAQLFLEAAHAFRSRLPEASPTLRSVSIARS